MIICQSRKEEHSNPPTSDQSHLTFCRLVDDNNNNRLQLSGVAPGRPRARRATLPPPLAGPFAPVVVFSFSFQFCFLFPAILVHPARALVRVDLPIRILNLRSINIVSTSNPPTRTPSASVLVPNHAGVILLMATLISICLHLQLFTLFTFCTFFLPSLLNLSCICHAINPHRVIADADMRMKIMKLHVSSLSYAKQITKDLPKKEKRASDNVY